MKIETVKIKSGDSYAIINKSDFDAKKHDLYQESQPKKAVKKATTKKAVK